MNRSRIFVGFYNIRQLDLERFGRQYIMGEPVLWRQCVNWLRDCTVLSKDDPVLSSGATFEDLARILRDGVLLCRLASHLSKHSQAVLEQITWTPNNSEYFCMQNIKIFLYVCGEHFGIEEKDLFKAEDLYQLHKMQLVLKTLAVLSQNPLVKENFPNVPSFSENTMDTNNQIYSVKVDTLYVNHDFFQPVKPMKTKMVIAELIKTEKFYLEKLNILRQKYMQPLKNVVSPEIFEQLSFYGMLVEKHCRLLQEIEEANDDNCAETRLCHVMMKFRKDNLHIYGSLALSRQMLTNLMANPEENVKAATALQAHCDEKDLAYWPDVLFEPNKRLVSYRELLASLGKATPEDHPSKRLIEKSRMLATSSIVLMENFQQQSSCFLVCKELQDKIVDLQLPIGKRLFDYGMILIEGSVTLIENKSKQNSVHCYAFLFQKLLLLTVGSGAFLGHQHQFKQRRIAVLADYHIEVPSLWNKLMKGGYFKFKSEVPTSDSDFSLKLKTRKEAEEWKSKLEEITEIKKLVKNRFNTHKFELTSFDELSVCGSCRDFVAGLNNNFKCSCCQMIAHKECISTAGHCVAKYDPALSVHNWFAGAITRDESDRLLKNREVGTYLVRVRPFDNRQCLYAFSVKTERGTKNARIVQSKNARGETMFGYESNCKEIQASFTSISQMVSYLEIDYFHRKNNANFPMCEPIRAVWALVIRDYQGNGTNKISLKKNEIIIIISKECDNLGWWRGKAKNNGQPGFFPKTFVDEMPEIQYNAR